MAAVLAGAAFVVVPEIEHGLAEMVHDVGAIEVDVFDERAAIVAIKNDVLVFAGRAAAFHDDADSVGWADRGVRDVWRNEERFAFANEVIDNAIALADPDFDVAFELVKIFLRIDQVKIIPRVRALDDHDEEVATVVEIKVADRRFKLIAVRVDPGVDVDRRQHFRGRAGADRWRS